jgi:hypothetical protein
MGVHFEACRNLARNRSDPRCVKDASSMRVPLGFISHFGVTVRDPIKSAEWWESHFEL